MTAQLIVMPVQVVLVGKRPVHHLAEVPALHPRAVLDQAEQIRAGRRHRPPDVVVGQSLQVPQQHSACVLQKPVQRLLLIGFRHGASLAQAQELVQRVSASAVLIRERGELVKHRPRGRSPDHEGFLRARHVSHVRFWGGCVKLHGRHPKTDGGYARVVDAIGGMASVSAPGGPDRARPAGHQRDLPGLHR